MKLNNFFTSSRLIILNIGLLFINNLYAQTENLNIDSLRNDVDVLFENIKEIHPNMFASISEEDIKNETFKIKSTINNKTDIFDFYTLVNSLVVKLNDGHTSIYFPYDELRRKKILLFPFPVEVNPIDSSVIVTNDYTEKENTIPIESEILSINDVPTKAIIKNMMEQVSGEKDYYKIDRLKYLFTPLLYSLYKANEFEIKFKMNDSVYKTKVLGIPYSERYKRQSKKNTSQTKPYSIKIDAYSNLAIIDFRQFVELENFSNFLDSTFTLIKKEKIQNLIIDVRNNGGGNSKLGDELFQYISKVPFKQFGQTTIKTSKQQKKFHKSEYNINDTSEIGIITKNAGELIELRKNDLRFNGKVYVLQSHHTFSSAASFSWAFKYFEMGEIIGEESGGLAVCFGDIVRQKLPFSKLSYTVSHKKFYQYGATDNDIHGTIPDYKVPANDALNYTIELINKRGQE